ncbi:hypothetical protein ElyMa_000156500 [Elysia marginata]|uniref:OAR domain-containing protein n=1 Tax=Elysia marginata TaxID=1093978 RepID=A0AAV4ESD8_9GAST|nr:hypothetical protein ElyMa_000156500 [Elysia marginata]
MSEASPAGGGSGGRVDSSPPGQANFRQFNARAAMAAAHHRAHIQSSNIDNSNKNNNSNNSNKNNNSNNSNVDNSNKNNNSSNSNIDNSNKNNNSNIY